MSQLAGLRGEKVNGRSKPLFWKMQSRFPAPKSRPYHWVAYVVVDKNWKLLASENGKHMELYDLGNDPLEEHDVSAAQAQEVRRMQQLLSEWKSTLPESPNPRTFSKERSALSR